MINATYNTANNVENTSTSAYIAKSLEIWHAMNMASIKKLKQMCLIPDLSNIE